MIQNSTHIAIYYGIAYQPNWLQGIYQTFGFSERYMTVESWGGRELKFKTRSLYQLAIL